MQPSPATKLVKRPPLWILIFMISLGPFGDTEYIPSLPAIAAHHGISYSLSQHTMTVYLLGYAFFQLVYGCFSDRYGRRPVMLFGSATFFLGSVLCYLSSGISWLLLGRFIQGVGSCAGATITSAAVRDAFPEKERPSTYAKINAAFALAPGIGPIVGSYIEAHYHWRMNFVLLLWLGLALLVAVFLGLAETNHNKRKDATNPKRLFYYYNLLWKDPVFVYYLVLLGCCMGIVYACLSEAPALVSLVLHLETHVIAVVSMGVMLGYIAGSIACAYLARRWKPNRILALGVGIVLAFSLLMGAFVTMGFVTLTSVLAPIIVIFSGIAIITPMAVSQALLPLAGVAGTASSLLGFAQMFFAALGTVFISVTRTGNAFAMPVTFTCFALLALVVFLVFIRPSDPKARLII